MHPILETRRRLLLYLLAWIPFAALVAAVVWLSGGVDLASAVQIVTPACAVYAFLCLSPWYVCRTRPLRTASIFSLATTFLAAAIAGSLVLVGCAGLTASALRKPAPQWAPLFGMGMLIYLVSVGLHYAFLAVEASAQAERSAAEARAMAREAELHALRIQLNPHFLFNSLHSISALATADGARAREMCIKLADFLRSSLRLGDRESISLGEELALARAYLEVEQVRFGSRLRVEEQVEPECLDCAIPVLLLQPLVENAVKHGIAGLLEGGVIRLEARRADGAVWIRVENGYDPEAAAPLKTGRGQVHVRKRLEARYGQHASFATGAKDERYWVDLRLPCESPMASSSRA